MKTRINLKNGALLLAFAAIGLASCKKDKTITNTDDGTITEETDYADDMASLDQTFDEVDNFAAEAESTGNIGMKGGFPLSGCASVTVDTVSTQHKIIINFGSTNCLCKDGRNRRGKIIVKYNGKYRDSGYVHTINFDGYYVNDNHVLGSKEVKNMGKNSQGDLYFDNSVDGHIVLTATGDTISQQAKKTRTWVSGENTLQLSDDAYRITGTGMHTKATGKMYITVITSPLLVALNCNWIKEGTVSITPAGGQAITLDYGNGTCDDKALLTVNGKTKQVQLH